MIEVRRGPNLQAPTAPYFMFLLAERRPQTSDVLILFNTRSPDVPTLSPGPAFRLESFFDGPGAR